MVIRCTVLYTCYNPVPQIDFTVHCMRRHVYGQILPIIPIPISIVIHKIHHLDPLKWNLLGFSTFCWPRSSQIPAISRHRTCSSRVDVMCWWPPRVDPPTATLPPPCLDAWFSLKRRVDADFEVANLVMTNSSPWKIDGLPNLKIRWIFPWRTLSHNQMAHNLHGDFHWLLHVTLQEMEIWPWWKSGHRGGPRDHTDLVGFRIWSYPLEKTTFLPFP